MPIESQRAAVSIYLLHLRFERKFSIRTKSRWIFPLNWTCLEPCPSLNKPAGELSAHLFILYVSAPIVSWPQYFCKNGLPQFTLHKFFFLDVHLCHNELNKWSIKKGLSTNPSIYCFHLVMSSLWLRINSPFREQHFLQCLDFRWLRWERRTRDKREHLDIWLRHSKSSGPLPSSQIPEQSTGAAQVT